MARPSPNAWAGCFRGGHHTGVGTVQFETAAQIQDIRVAGDLACCWNHLTVTMTPRQGGEPMVRAGHTLTVFQKINGRWLLTGDANLMAAVKP